jgi:hypothetical protein
MRRLIPMLISLTLLASACSSPGTTSTTTEPEGSTTGATPSTTPGVGTTEALTTTSAAVTTTVPGAFAVDATDYCVRGTASSDALNVRSGPGVEYQVLGDLAWNASGIRATGQGAPDSKGRTWLGVEYSGGIGWSAGWYLVPGPCTAANDDPAPLSDPALPAALSGGLVPWPLVDDQWVLALSASDAGATALYLMDPFGDTYEVFSWPGPSVRPFDLFDWRPDGRAALLQVGFDASGDKEILLIDLEKRTSETVLTTPELGFGGPATFTRPTGKDIVVAAGDDLTEHIEVRRSDGSIFSVLFDGPRPAGPPVPVAWIYGLEGTTAVVGDASGLHLVSNKGEPIRDLASPGASCRPIRWWDQDTVLARCVPPEVLAYLPDAYYNRLWLVPSDGSDGARAHRRLRVRGCLATRRKGLRPVDGRLLGGGHPPGRGGRQHPGGDRPATRRTTGRQPGGAPMERLLPMGGRPLPGSARWKPGRRPDDRPGRQPRRHRRPHDARLGLTTRTPDGILRPSLRTGADPVVRLPP